MAVDRFLGALSVVGCLDLVAVVRVLRCLQLAGLVVSMRILRRLPLAGLVVLTGIAVLRHLWLAISASIAAAVIVGILAVKPTGVHEVVRCLLPRHLESHSGC